MTSNIIAVPPFSGNKENQPKSKNQALSVKPSAYVNTEIGTPIKHSNVKEMIQRLLTCDRIIAVPTRVQSYTVLELAKELDITPLQIMQLRTSSWRHEKLAWRIRLPLITLYCGTKFYKPKQ